MFRYGLGKRRCEVNELECTKACLKVKLFVLLSEDGIFGSCYLSCPAKLKVL